MNLTEVVEIIKKSYTQTSIITKVFDFEKIKEIDAIQPKYFYRGEDNIYSSTNTTLFRLIQKGEIDIKELMVVHYNLYVFLREAIYGISCIELTDHGNPNIELSIAGVLQHYGFDTLFIDVTSNLEVAANFAARNEVGSKGRILVIESNSLNYDEVNYYFDLTKCSGTRPKIQSSYVIWDQFRNLDLKKVLFLSKHGGIWIDFELTKKDKETFCDETILSVMNDEIAHHINDWWKYSSFIKNMSPSMKGFIFNKIEKLNGYK